MSDKILVMQVVDPDNRITYIARGEAAYSMAELSKKIGVPEENCSSLPSDEVKHLIRQQRRQELSRQANTPEAIRRRTDINPFTGLPNC